MYAECMGGGMSSHGRHPGDGRHARSCQGGTGAADFVTRAGEILKIRAKWHFLGRQVAISPPLPPRVSKEKALLFSRLCWEQVKGDLSKTTTAASRSAGKERAIHEGGGAPHFEHRGVWSFPPGKGLRTDVGSSPVATCGMAGRSA